MSSYLTWHSVLLLNMDLFYLKFNFQFLMHIHLPWLWRFSWPSLCDKSFTSRIQVLLHFLEKISCLGIIFWEVSEKEGMNVNFKTCVLVVGEDTTLAFWWFSKRAHRIQREMYSQLWFIAQKEYVANSAEGRERSIR